MRLSALGALLATHAKVATAAVATAAVTTGGGLAVASAVNADNPHGQAGLAKAAAAQAAHHDSATTDESSDTATSAPTGTDVTLPECPADVKNHGAYVSSVAKMKPAEGDAPNAHGKLVSAAAKSDCGKPAAGSDDGEDTGDDTDGDTGESGPSSHANSHAKSHPTAKPDTAGKSGQHSQAGQHGKPTP